MSPRELHRQLCNAVLKHTGRSAHRSTIAERPPTGLVNELLDAGAFRFRNEPEFHARATYLGQLLELIEPELPPIATVSNRELALRVLTVLPIVDACIPDPDANTHVHFVTGRRRW
jgi:hypothetical protein